MNRNIFRKFLSLSLILCLFPVGVFANPKGIELQDLALPSELKDLSKSSGAVYYSSPNKNKTLMPVHIWGEVQKPGLHFIPVDTKLVKGLSFAGGGSSTANLEKVVVNRMEGDQVSRKKFDLKDGGDISAFEYTLKPGDTVFIERDRSMENRAYYTSLVAVVVAVLSGALIYKRIEEKSP